MSDLISWESSVKGLNDVGCGQWGEKIFPTREAAEAAIKEKEKENG